MGYIFTILLVLLIVVGAVIFLVFRFEQVRVGIAVMLAPDITKKGFQAPILLRLAQAYKNVSDAKDRVIEVQSNAGAHLVQTYQKHLILYENKVRELTEENDELKTRTKLLLPPLAQGIAQNSDNNVNFNDNANDNARFNADFNVNIAAPKSNIELCIWKSADSEMKKLGLKGDLIEGKEGYKNMVAIYNKNNVCVETISYNEMLQGVEFEGIRFFICHYPPCDNIVVASNSKTTCCCDSHKVQLFNLNKKDN